MTGAIFIFTFQLLLLVAFGIDQTYREWKSRRADIHKGAGSPEAGTALTGIGPKRP